MKKDGIYSIDIFDNVHKHFTNQTSNHYCSARLVKIKYVNYKSKSKDVFARNNTTNDCT